MEYHGKLENQLQKMEEEIRKCREAMADLPDIQEVTMSHTFLGTTPTIALWVPYDWQLLTRIKEELEQHLAWTYKQTKEVYGTGLPCIQFMHINGTLLSVDADQHAKGAVCKAVIVGYVEERRPVYERICP